MECILGFVLFKWKLLNHNLEQTACRNGYQLHNDRNHFAFALFVINTPKFIRNQNIEKFAQFQF